MNTSFIFNRFLRSERTWLYIISLFWLLGLSVGIAFGAAEEQHVTNVVYNDLFCEPSLLSVIFSVALPLALISLILHYRLFFFIIPIVFVISLIRGFCATFLFVQLGSGAWLIRSLYLFSGSCTSLLVWWLLFRHGTRVKTYFKKDLRLVTVLSALIVIIDISFISPFLQRLSFYF